MMMAPAFLKGDRNGDGKLSRAEFDGLGERGLQSGMRRRVAR